MNFKKTIPWVFSGIGIFILNLLREGGISVRAVAISALFGLIVAGIVAGIVLSWQRGFFSFLNYKLRETLKYFSAPKKLFTPPAVQYDCFKFYEYHSNTLRCLNKFICDNQGMLADFSYSVAERHKLVKNQIQASNPNPALIKKYSNELRDYINNKLTTTIFPMNHALMMSYFNARSAYLPRIVIKAQKGGKIIDLYRDAPEYSSPQEIGESSGSDHVLNKGKWFVCNDIPAAIKDEMYKNPRIDCVKVRRHLGNHGSFQSDTDWIDCWYENENLKTMVRSKPSPESCYKSTLIIPMTLLRNKFSEQFRKHFQIPTLNDEDELSRAIYGLLCFDHQHANYFEQELDEKAGYIFADVISLYLINELMFTSYSQTYQRAIKIVDT